MKTIITAKHPLLELNLKELRQFSDLLWLLAYRDYRVRYAQTFLGFAWAIVQPALTLVIFILVFNKAAQVHTDEIPYPVFAMTGMWAWSYFGFVLAQSSHSLISSHALITKVYFPRLIIPLAKSLVGFVDFMVTLLMLATLMVYFRFTPSANLIALPVWVLFVLVLTLAVGIWVSALTIRFRDIQHVVPFLVQIGLYVTPVAYPSARIPEQYHSLFYLNPMAAVVDGFRWAILGTPLPALPYLLYSIAITLVLLLSGLYYFKRTERIMADII